MLSCSRETVSRGGHASWLTDTELSCGGDEIAKMRVDEESPGKFMVFKRWFERQGVALKVFPVAPLQAKRPPAWVSVRGDGAKPEYGKRHCPSL